MTAWAWLATGRSRSRRYTGISEIILIGCPSASKEFLYQLCELILISFFRTDLQQNGAEGMKLPYTFCPHTRTTSPLL